MLCWAKAPFLMSATIRNTEESAMSYNAERPARRSPRLRGYEYSQEGAYFVTVCVQHRLPLFGAVQDGEMRLNNAGRMVADCWKRLPTKFPDVVLDLYCVMP